MRKWEPGHFGGHLDENFATELWRFLNRKENLVRMETASDLRRPAVEPLSKLLVEEFGDEIWERNATQVIGAMTRQIMESRGFAFDMPGVKIRFGELFTAGARYRRIETEA